MPNSNPLTEESDSNYPDFEIPSVHADKILTLSTATRVSEPGWLVDAMHVLSCNGKLIATNGVKHLNNCKIGKAADVANLTMGLVSKIGAVKKTGVSGPTIVHSFTLYADQQPLDTFEIQSSTNPTKFYLRITFRIL